jgi:hypothetical protein
MNQVEISPAPVLPVPAQDKWRSEQEAFQRLFPDLLLTHCNQYVAIHEGKVVASGPDKMFVASQAYARVGYIPIYVSLVTDQPPRVSP